MSDSRVVEQARQWLADNDASIKAVLAEVPAGVAATLLVRALDAQFVRAVMLDGPKDEGTFVLLDLFLKGSGYALSLLTERFASEPPPALVPTTPEMEPWTHGLLIHCGWTVLVRELLEAAEAGHLTLEVEGEAARTFTFVAPELSDERIGRARAQTYGSLLAACEAGDQARKAVAGVDSEALGADVASSCMVYQQHYLAYRTTESIRATVSAMAAAYAGHLERSQQTVVDDARLGDPERLAVYRRVCQDLYATGFEQVLFTRALLMMEPDLHLENLLTPLKSWPHVADDMATRLQLPAALVREITGLLVASPFNFGEASRPRWMVVPPYVQLQEGAILQSVTGHLLAPLVFLLQEVGRRETPAQACAERWFLGSDPFRLPLQPELKLGDVTVRLRSA